MNKNEMRQLGKTEIKVTPVALGCWPIAGMTSLDVNESDSLMTIRTAVDRGINFFDTAYCYGADGVSERLLGQVVRECRDTVVIATKAGIHWDERLNKIRDARPSRIVRECEESLQRMGIDTIDLYYLHAPDPNVSVAESAEAFATLMQSGKIRAAGVSNVSVEQLIAFHEVCPVSAVQPPYNMLQRQIEADLIPWCLQNQISVINYWPLMKGLLAGKIRRGHRFDPNDKRLTYEVFQGESFEHAQQLLDLLDQVAKESGRTVAQIVTNWTFHRQGITSTLCGAKRGWQIDEVAGAMGWELDSELVEKIDQFLAANVASDASATR